jgi:hypothetical protein
MTRTGFIGTLYDYLRAGAAGNLPPGHHDA